MKLYKHIRGYSLIELLIGLLLSTILMAGVLEIFTSMSRGYNMRYAMSRTQEDGRYAIEVLSRELRHTGYRIYKPNPDDISDIFQAKTSPFPSTINFQEDVRIIGINGLPDAFMIRYQASSAQDLQESLCFGGSGAATTLSPLITDYKISNPVVTEKFYIENNALKCDSRLDYNNFVNNKEKNAVTLIENVHTMRVLYGINTTPLPATGSPAADYLNYYIPNKYVDASAVISDQWKDEIRSVRISLVLRSENSNITDFTSSTMKINGNKSITIASTDQKRLFRDFSTTVMLRNIILFPAL